MSSLDVRDVFRNPRKVIAWLEAGKTMALIDENGRVFARVTPETPAASVGKRIRTNPAKASNTTRKSAKAKSKS